MKKKNYCYKFKSNYLRINKKEVREFLEKELGLLVYEPQDEADTELFIARPFKLEKEDVLYRYIKKQIEDINKTENKSERLEKELKESGYEFNEDGTVVENETFLNGMPTSQLCVSINGEMKGCLFINLEGLEFYHIDVINGCANAKKIADKLVKNKVVYKKLLKD